MSTAIEPVIEEVATNLDEAANAVRMLDARVMGAFTFGVATGVVMGFVWGYKYDKKKLRAEIQKESEEEIAQIREYYQQKTIARQGEVEKQQSVEEIVEDRGYVSPVGEKISYPPPPLPDAPIVEEKVTGHPLSRPEVEVREVLRPERPLPPPVPIIDDSPDVVNTWDYRTEARKRTENPGLPYVIHEEEFNAELPGYDKTSYTYYPVDDVLTDEDGSVLLNRDDLIGVGTLDRFGHGSEDPDIVHVRNNRLKLHIEVDRLENRSYEEDVEGLSREDFGQHVGDS